MNTKFFALALTELLLSLVIGVLMLYISYVLINRLIRLRYRIRTDNTAFGIVTSGILLSVGLIISRSIEPMLSAIRILNSTIDDAQKAALESAYYIVMFLVISMLIALFTNLTGLYLYIRLTKINEFEEISKNNIAVGLVVGTIVVVIAIFVRDSMAQLLESIVPYPNLPVSPIK